MTSTETKPFEHGSQQRFVFVVGNNRCGTTMMRRILENHPAVFGFREMRFFERLWSPKSHDQRLPLSGAMELAANFLCLQRYGKLFNQDDLRRNFSRARDIIGSMQDKPLTRMNIYQSFLVYETLRNNKAVPCEKSPRNVFYIKELLEFFPNSRIINMVRDPRDVLLSQKRHWQRRYLGGNHRPLGLTIGAWINYHPITISKLWNTCVNAADKFSTDDRVLTVRFEDLVGEPKDTVRRVFGFLEMLYSDDLLNIPQGGSSIESDNPGQKGINPRRSNRWQRGGLNSTEVHLCQKISSSLMRKHGYEPVHTRPNPVRVVHYMVSLGLQFPVASFLFLKRVESVGETIRRFSA